MSGTWNDLNRAKAVRAAQTFPAAMARTNVWSVHVGVDSSDELCLEPHAAFRWCASNGALHGRSGCALMINNWQVVDVLFLAGILHEEDGRWWPALRPAVMAATLALHLSNVHCHYQLHLRGRS